MNNPADYALIAFGILVLLFVFAALIGGAVVSHRETRSTRVENEEGKAPHSE